MLVASPVLADPNFMRSVVYVLEHTASGTLGLVLNRPLDVPLGDLWDECPEALGGEQLCAEGGPVDRHKGLLLHGFTELEDTYQLAEGIAVGGDPHQLHALSEAESSHHGPRLFLGHAGWQPGQLEEEIALGSWLVREAHPVLLLHPQPPEDLWQEMVSCYGEATEPSVN